MKDSRIERDAALLLEYYGLQGLDASALYLEHYAPMTNITIAGQDISALRIVLAGRAKAYRISESGRPLIVCRYISEGLIGELELLTDQPAATTTVTAITAVDCLAIGYDRCRAELRSNLTFTNQLARIMAEKLNESAQNYAATALHSGQQRLCAYLVLNSNENFFSEPLNDTASTLGMSYRHMERLLAALSAEALIRREGRGYRLLAPREMARIGGLNPE